MRIKLHCTTVPRDGWEEVFLTAVATAPLKEVAELRLFYDEVAARVALMKLEILQERVYGLVEQMDPLLGARRDAFAGQDVVSETPVTYLEGAPCIGGLLAGVQIIGAIPSPAAASCSTLWHGSTPVGRVLSTGNCRMLFLSGISGLDPQADSGVTGQAERMFERMTQLLELAGFSPTQVVRTWIYLARLLDWYGEFNRVRTACYRRLGLITDDKFGRVPASTGIQCRRYPGEECVMDLLAIAPDAAGTVRIWPMETTRQNQAYDYGSSFARGMAVRQTDPPTLYISGTASINGRGETIYHADHQGQILETLLDVASLLDTEQTRANRLHDICQATAFCKTPENFRAFTTVLESLSLSGIPFVSVFADVCRDELLFEMDAIACHAQNSWVEEK